MFHIKDGILFFKSIVFFFFEHNCCGLLKSFNFILSVQKSISQQDCGLSTCLLGISNVALLCLSKVGSSTMAATLSQMTMYSVTLYCCILILEISQDFFDLFFLLNHSNYSSIQSGVNFSLEAMSRREKQSLCSMDYGMVDDIYLY